MPGARGGPARRASAPADLARIRDSDLAPAVVAAGRRLQAERGAELDRRRAEASLVRDLAPRCRRDPQASNEATFGEPILGHPQGACPGTNRDAGRLHGVDKRRVDVLQLVGYDGAALGQLDRALHRVVGGDHDAIGDRGRRTVWVRVKDGDPVAHRAGREPQHSPQLPAAEDPDRGAGRHGGAEIVRHGDRSVWADGTSRRPCPAVTERAPVVPYWPSHPGTPAAPNQEWGRWLPRGL